MLNKSSNNTRASLSSLSSARETLEKYQNLGVSTDSAHIKRATKALQILEIEEDRNDTILSSEWKMGPKWHLDGSGATTMRSTVEHELLSGVGPMALPSAVLHNRFFRAAANKNPELLNGLRVYEVEALKSIVPITETTQQLSGYRTNRSNNIETIETNTPSLNTSLDISARRKVDLLYSTSSATTRKGIDSFSPAIHIRSSTTTSSPLPPSSPLPSSSASPPSHGLSKVIPQTLSPITSSSSKAIAKMSSPTVPRLPLNDSNIQHTLQSRANVEDVSDFDILQRNKRLITLSTAAHGFEGSGCMPFKAAADFAAVTQPLNIPINNLSTNQSNQLSRPSIPSLNSLTRSELFTATPIERAISPTPNKSRQDEVHLDNNESETLITSQSSTPSLPPPPPSQPLPVSQLASASIALKTAEKAIRTGGTKSGVISKLSNKTVIETALQTAEKALKPIKATKSALPQALTTVQKSITPPKTNTKESSLIQTSSTSIIPSDESSLLSQSQSQSYLTGYKELALQVQQQQSELVKLQMVHLEALRVATVEAAAAATASASAASNAAASTALRKNSVAISATDAAAFATSLVSKLHEKDKMNGRSLLPPSSTSSGGSGTDSASRRNSISGLSKSKSHDDTRLVSSYVTSNGKIKTAEEAILDKMNVHARLASFNASRRLTMSSLIHAEEKSSDTTSIESTPPPPPPSIPLPPSLPVPIRGSWPLVVLVPPMYSALNQQGEQQQQRVISPPQKQQLSPFQQETSPLIRHTSPEQTSQVFLQATGNTTFRTNSVQTTFARAIEDVSLKTQPHVNSLPPPPPLHRRVQLYPPATSIVPGASEFVDRYQVARRKREDAQIEEQQRTLLYSHNDKNPSNASQLVRNVTNNTVLLHTETRAVKRRSYYAAHVLSKNSATIEWKTEAEVAGIDMESYNTPLDEQHIQMMNNKAMMPIDSTSGESIIESLNTVLDMNVDKKEDFDPNHKSNTRSQPIEHQDSIMVVSTTNKDFNHNENERTTTLLNNKIQNTSLLLSSAAEAAKTETSEISLPKKLAKQSSETVISTSHEKTQPNDTVVVNQIQIHEKKGPLESTTTQQKSSTDLNTSHIISSSSSSNHDDSVVSVKHLSDEELSTHIHEMSEEELRNMLIKTKKASEKRGFSHREREKKDIEREALINGMNADAVYEAMAANSIKDLNKSGVNANELGGALKSIKFSTS
jgi:hypothetical protein